MTPVVELVTTGAELLSGRTLNRHAQWLGGELDRLGWRLLRDTTVPDDLEAIRDAITGALARCDVVICTGGLGPTSDDVTRDVAAAWYGSSLVMDEPARLHVLDVYARRNKPLNDLVERHALVVKGARVLQSNHGLAPGEHLEKNGKHLFLLPGPPREFQGVMRDHVQPWIEAQSAGHRVRRHIFQVAGLGESDIAARLNHRGFGELRNDVAYCAAPSRVTIRIEEQTAFAGDFDRALKLVHDELGTSIYAEREVAIEAVVMELLRQQGKTFAVAESCTGGMLGQKITALPGSSAVFCGGVVAYHNDVKERLLGVSAEVLAAHGAVSEPVAQAMAESVRVRCHADYGVAITGIAGPGGATPDKPVGLVVVAVADGNVTRVEPLRLGGARDIIREAAVMMALDLLRRQLTAG